MSYYKTQDESVLAAANTYFEDMRTLNKQIEAFRELFGAKHGLIISRTGHSVFCGLVFVPKMDDKYWTKATLKNKFIQYPRATVAKATQEEKEEQVLLLKKWRDNLPNLVVIADEIYKALGFDSSALFENSFSCFLKDNFFYAKTEIKMPDCMVEILGSEYDREKAGLV